MVYHPHLINRIIQPLSNNDCAPAMVATLPQYTSVSHDDCAPNDTPSAKVMSAIDGLQRMQHVAQLYNESLPHGYMLVFSPFSPNGVTVLNAPAWKRLQLFFTPRLMTEAVDFTFWENNLIAPVGQVPQLTWQPPTTLTVWLHITNACNLDCPYCYIRKSSAKMNLATGYSILDKVFRSASDNGFDTVELKYAGGEAAMHFSLVKQLHNYAQKLSAQYGIALKAVILSNGTIWTPAMANWLVSHHITLVISLDGVGAVHNSLRPSVTGKGTFKKVEHNIDYVLRPVGVTPEIAITISGRNAGTTDEIVVWALDRNLPFTLNFYRENILSRDRDALKIEESAIISGMKKTYRQIEKKLSQQLSVSGLLDKTNLRAHTHTCGVGQNYLVFSHQGKLTQCQMALDTATEIDEQNDLLAIVANGNIPHLSVDEKEGCQSCVWRYRCTGGCPVETYRVTGRFDVKSPHCNIYTALFPDVLRLEGLHILKINGIL